MKAVAPISHLQYKVSDIMESVQNDEKEAVRRLNPQFRTLQEMKSAFGRKDSIRTVVVRHPFHRLVAAYRETVESLPMTSGKEGGVK